MWIGFDLAPDTAYQYVDAPPESTSVAALGKIEQIIAGKYPSSSFAKSLQKVELGTCHGDACGIRAPHFALTKIDLPAKKRKYRRLVGQTGAMAESLPSHDGVYSCQSSRD